MAARRKNLPLDAVVHEQASIAAELLGETLKDFVQQAVAERIRRNRKRLERAARARQQTVDKLLGGE